MFGAAGGILSMFGGKGGAGGGMMKMIRSGIDVTKGAVNMARGIGAQKKADAAAPPLSDPGQLATLEYLKQKAKGFGTGSGFSVGKGLVQSQTAATQATIARNTGGDINATQNALLKSQGMGNEGINQVLAEGAQREEFFTQAFVQQENLIAQRKLELQLLKQSKLEAKAASLTQSGDASLTSGLKMT